MQTMNEPEPLFPPLRQFVRALAVLFAAMTSLPYLFFAGMGVLESKSVNAILGLLLAGFFLLGALGLGNRRRYAYWALLGANALGCTLLLLITAALVVKLGFSRVVQPGGPFALLIVHAVGLTLLLWPMRSFLERLPRRTTSANALDVKTPQ